MDLPEYPRGASVGAVRKIDRERERITSSLVDLDARQRTVSDAFVDALDAAEKTRTDRERIRALARTRKPTGGRAR